MHSKDKNIKNKIFDFIKYNTDLLKYSLKLSLIDFIIFISYLTIN